MKEIPLTQGKVALVDDEDYERLITEGKWIFNKKGYAMRSFHFKKNNIAWTTKTIQMHRFILGLTDPMVIVDHINGNSLDNRKINLRECNRFENARNARKRKDNSSGFKGVSLHKQTNKWAAYIGFNKKLIHLGLFDCRIEAARAYNAAAIKYHGEFANLNPI